jgi:SAM-dependent methyltransferase
MTKARLVGDNYDEYLSVEWEMFAQDPARAQAALDAVARMEVNRVLDIGCGAGQELRPFVAAGAFGVGTDVAPEVGILGRKLFAREDLPGKVTFVRSAAEHLPFASGSFEVLVCRLALPYTDNRRALGEMARVLRPGGLLFLKIHHAWFYAHKFWSGLLTGRLLYMVHSLRVLVGGTLYHLTGNQVRNRLVTNETFQSGWMLKNELARHSLSIVHKMPDSNPLTPSFVIRKAASSA